MTNIFHRVFRAVIIPTISLQFYFLPPGTHRFHKRMTTLVAN